MYRNPRRNATLKRMRAWLRFTSTIGEVAVGSPVLLLLLLSCCTVLPTTTTAFSSNAWPSAARMAGGGTKPTTHLSASPATSTTTTTSRLTATSVDTHIYTTLVDGPCWQALQETPLVVTSENDSGTAKHGALSIVTGTLAGTEQAVVALLAADDQTDNSSSSTATLTTGERVWTESVAQLPPSSSNTAAAAATTMALALTTLYPLLATQATAVGGSPTTDFLGLIVPSKVVVMGGNPLAVWAAQSLTTWQQKQSAAGDTAFVVTTSKPPSSLASTTGITVLSGKDDEAFCQRVGQFDAVLDTVGSESTAGRSVMLLKRQHGCSTYTSTRTQAETVVASQGLLFGPGKAKKYLQDLGQAQSRRSATATTRIRPVPGWGQLVEQLWDVPLPADIFQTVNTGSGTTTWVRGWSLPDMWESTTWPSNTDGTRYGFPTMEDDEEEEDEEDYDDGEDGIVSVDTSATESEEPIPRRTSSASSSSPYILQIYGDEGLEKDIVEPELDCILFMAAPYCRTCQKLRSPYARLARLNFEDDESDVVFAKADIVGKFGKSLGKALGIKAVPTFLLFRNGQRFGKPLTISKLPNPQLDMALKYLKERTEWNDDDDKQFSASPSKQDEEISVKGITLKIAIDSQGGVADLAASKSERFTSPASLDRVHRLRRTAQAVLVGRGTVAFDNPSLTIRRGVPAPSTPPLRVILDSQLSLPMERVEHGSTFQLLEDGLPTVVYHAVKDVDDESLNLFEQTEIVQVPPTKNDQLDVGAVWKDLQTHRKVSHLMVEGGPATARSFLQAGLVDRVMLVQAKGVTFEKPVPSEIDAESLGSFGLERLGSFEEEGDVTECWARPGENWPTDGLDDWP